MPESSAATLDAIRIVVTLLAVAAVTAVVANRLRISYTVSLVALGLIAGALVPRGAVEVTPELVLLVLVPGLVFEAALRFDAEHLRRTLGWMLLLAAPGVLISAAIVAVVLNVATGLPLELGMVVGAMVAATDPVAVIATFRSLAVPRRLATLVEGESLLNDGTAIVLFTISVAAISRGATPSEMATSALVTIFGSVVIGLAAGWLASRLIALIEDVAIELAISLAAAYGVYFLADDFGLSGIIATVVAGVMIGASGRAGGLSHAAVDALDVVWEFIAFVLTAFAFLLVGLAISFDDLLASAGPIAAGIVAIVVGRVVVVYGLLGGVARLLRGRTGQTEVPAGWLHVLYWAGLRGAVAVAMALSLPEEFPQRALLQQITFGVVLFTLFVQGTTAARVVARATSGASAPAGGAP